MSMVAGGGSGGLLLLLGYKSLNEFKTSKTVSPIWSQGSLVISLMLLGVMGIRFQKTGKFMPAGLVAVVSLAMSTFYVSKILPGQKKEKK
jgi:uncharacterized membrane protein (UPF0136 family)